MEPHPPESGNSPTTEPVRDARLGRVIGGTWTLTSVAGVGGMATVYAAKTREGRDGALKILHPEFRGSPGIEHGFLREAAIMRSVQHDGVLRVLDEGRTKDGDPYFAMELLDGMSLTDFLEQQGGRLGLQESLLIGIQVLEILGSVHARGIIHRDVKPSNLFIMRNGVVKLLDFGVAMLPTDEHDEEEGSRLGTPAYMPPEQAMNAARGVDARSDLFAAGATLYLLLSGEKIRDAATPEEVFVLAATTQPPSLARHAPDLPIGLIRAIDRSLAWNPQDRFETAEAFSDELATFLEGGEGEDDAEQRKLRRESLRSVLAKALAEGAASLEEILFGRRTMREYMRPFASVLVALHRQGWESDDTRAKFDILMDETQKTGKALGTGVIMTVRPHSFEYLGDCIWEPAAPLNEIPYVLFLGGFRTIRILPDIPRQEMVSYLNLLMLDPVRDLSPEDDLGSIFLETGFPHVDAELITSFDMTLLDEASNLDEQLAEVRATIDAHLDSERAALEEAAGMAQDFGARSVIEARAIEVRISDQPGQGNVRRIELGQIEKALSEHMGQTISRAARVLQAAVRDAWTERDEDLILDPLRELVDAMALQRRIPEIVGLVDILLRAVPPNTIPELIHGIIHLRALRKLVEEAESPIEYDGRIYRALEMPAFPEIISHAASAHFAPLAELYVEEPTTATGQLLGGVLSQNTAGNEECIGGLLETAPPEAAETFLRGLIAHPTSAAMGTMRRAAKNPSERVRLLAMRGRVHLRDPSISEDFDAILRAQDGEVRTQALRIVREHSLSGLSGVLQAIALESRFHTLPLKERQVLLTTLLQVQSRVGEQTCMDLIRPDSLLPDAAHDPTRTLAAQLLGSLGSTPQIAEFLESEAKRFVRHSREFRTTLSQSAESLRERMRSGRSR